MDINNALIISAPVLTSTSTQGIALVATVNIMGAGFNVGLSEVFDLEDQHFDWGFITQIEPSKTYSDESRCKELICLPVGTPGQGTGFNSGTDAGGVGGRSDVWLLNPSNNGYSLTLDVFSGYSSDFCHFSQEKSLGSPYVISAGCDEYISQPGQSAVVNILSLMLDLVES